MRTFFSAAAVGASVAACVGASVVTCAGAWVTAWVGAGAGEAVGFGPQALNKATTTKRVNHRHIFLLLQRDLCFEANAPKWKDMPHFFYHEGLSEQTLCSFSPRSHEGKENFVPWCPCGLFFSYQEVTKARREEEKFVPTRRTQNGLFAVHRPSSTSRIIL
jgi:hypothetical protein